MVSHGPTLDKVDLLFFQSWMHRFIFEVIPHGSSPIPMLEVVGLEY